MHNVSLIRERTLLARSRLYRLEPCGPGSPFVESLTSYVARLAAAHAVKPSVLVADELLPRLDKGYLPGSRRVSGTTWKKLVAINGMGTWSTEWAHTVEDLTCWASLRSLTLLEWSSLVAPRGLLRRTRAWCPDCLQEWRQNGTPVYEPLIWLIEPVTACAVHWVALQISCPCCGREMLPLEGATVPGHCSKCSGWLGQRQTSVSIQTPVALSGKWEIYVVSAVADMLVRVPSSEAAVERWHVGAKLAEVTARIYGSDIREFARTVGISPRSASDILAGYQTPTLATLLQICYRLGTTPSALLSGEKCPAEVGPISGPTWERRRSIKHQRAFAEEHMRAALQSALDAITPRSMAQVARSLDYDHSYLSKRYPLLCRAISRRYLEWVRAEREKMAKALRKEIYAAVMTIWANGEYPTYKRVQGKLSAGRRMRDRASIEAWHEALAQVGLRSAGKQSTHTTQEIEPAA